MESPVGRAAAQKRVVMALITTGGLVALAFIAAIVVLGVDPFRAAVLFVPIHFLATSFFVFHLWRVVRVRQAAGDNL